MKNYQNFALLVQCGTYILLLIVVAILLWPQIRRFYYINKIPGPRAYPLIGSALMFRQTGAKVTMMILKELGKLMPICKVWMGLHPLVLISNPDDIQKVLTSPSALEKSWIFRQLGKDFFGDPILIAAVPKWKKNRKLVMSGLSQSILNSFVPHFVHESEVLVKQLSKEVGKKEAFDVYGYIARATMDSVTGAAMGVNVNAQVKDSPFFNALNKGLDLLFERGYNILHYPDVLYNLTKDSKTFKECADVLFKITDRVIETKRYNRISKLHKTPSSPDLGIQKNPLQKPFLDFLLDLNERNSMTNEEVRDETNIMITAAYETSAISISYMLLTIAANPEVQAKVYEEICNVVGPKNRLTDVGDIGNLQYMDMVIKETMRMHPTVPYILREIQEDIQLENYILPKGCTCAITIMFTHNDEKIWKNPEEFIPERFLPSETQKRHPFAFIPFSAGPRNCIGIKYANMFMKIVLLTILQEYELHTPLKLNKMEYKFELSLKLVGGHLLTLTKREQKNKNF